MKCYRVEKDEGTSILNFPFCYCSQCKRETMSTFIYCPWCGHKFTEHEIEHIKYDDFKKMFLKDGEKEC